MILGKTALTSRPWIILPVVLCAGFLALAVTPTMRRAIEATRALEALEAVGHQAEADSKAHLNRVSPLPMREVRYFIDGRFRTADLYLDSAAPKASLVLVPGADVLGREHPQFQALAAVLSRFGFAVLVPHMENLQHLRIRVSDITQIADAAQHMARFAPKKSGPSVGILAVSYGVGPAVLAALDKQARPDVRYVLGIGGYYDLEAVLTYLTTGKFRARPGDRWQTAEPRAHGKWVFLASNVEYLENPQDQVTLRLVANRKFADPQADISDLTPMLSPQVEVVLELITNTDPARVPVLIDSLPEGALANFRALDVSERDLSDLHARLILIHGRGDRLIPFTESQALARAANRTPGGASLYIIDNMAHVTLAPSDAVDAWKLFRAVFELLTLRDAAPAPTIPRALAKPFDLQGAASGEEAAPDTAKKSERNDQ